MKVKLLEVAIYIGAFIDLYVLQSIHQTWPIEFKIIMKLLCLRLEAINYFIFWYYWIKIFNKSQRNLTTNSAVSSHCLQTHVILLVPNFYNYFFFKFEKLK